MLNACDDAMVLDARRRVYAGSPYEGKQGSVLQAAWRRLSGVFSKVGVWNPVSNKTTACNGTVLARPQVRATCYRKREPRQDLLSIIGIALLQSSKLSD